MMSMVGMMEGARVVDTVVAQFASLFRWDGDAVKSYHSCSYLQRD